MGERVQFIFGIVYRYEHIWNAYKLVTHRCVCTWCYGRWHICVLILSQSWMKKKTSICVLCFLFYVDLYFELFSTHNFVSLSHSQSFVSFPLMVFFLLLFLFFSFHFHSISVFSMNEIWFIPLGSENLRHCYVISLYFYFFYQRRCFWEKRMLMTVIERLYIKNHQDYTE